LVEKIAYFDIVVVLVLELWNVGWIR